MFLRLRGLPRRVFLLHTRDGISGQWSPIPSVGSPNLEPLFPSEPSDPPAEPAASTSAASRVVPSDPPAEPAAARVVKWSDPRLHLWKTGGFETFHPGASIALAQVVPTPQWAEETINNSGTGRYSTSSSGVLLSCLPQMWRQL